MLVEIGSDRRACPWSGVGAPALGWRDRPRERLGRGDRFFGDVPFAGSQSPIFADFNPPFEIRGENETVVCQLAPNRARKLLLVLGGHADAPVLPASPRTQPSR
jgi:hypothetical protein